MIVAAAQTKPFKNNIQENILDHLRLIELAAQKGVQLIVFPEMSLTGYERELAETVFFYENDARLDVFKEKAILYNLVIIVGAPIKINSQLYIGAFIFIPFKEVLIYTKQFLHTGEEFFFSPSSKYNPMIELNNEIISLAICADITNSAHPKNAYDNKTTLYIASIFYTPNGIAEAYEQLSHYAKTFSMKILMSNYGGPSYNFESAGQSAFWDSNGVLIEKIENQEEELLIIHT
jgi:predicted amidohydrolase